MKKSQNIISKEEIEKVAELSRIKLSGREKDKVAGQLESVLSSVKVLEEIDTANLKIEEVSEKLGYDNLRSDEAKEADNGEKEAIRENFSSRKGDFLSVKSMF